jgi:hypothetical protein
MLLVIDVYYPSKKTIEEYEEYEKKHLTRQVGGITIEILSFSQQSL